MYQESKAIMGNFKYLIVPESKNNILATGFHYMLKFIRIMDPYTFTVQSFVFNQY